MTCAYFNGIGLMAQALDLSARGPWRRQVTWSAWHWRSTWPTRPSTGSATTPGPGSSGIADHLGLTPEKPQARLRFCRFDFAPDWGFRAALHEYYRIFPEAFRRRIDKQGLWMPSAKISRIKGGEDFGFQFKEGNDEIASDDAQGIFTFHYTEPLTWWMPMPATMPRTVEAATVKPTAGRTGAGARGGLLQSGYHNAEWAPAAMFRDQPWNHGGTEHEVDARHRGRDQRFQNQVESPDRQRLYGPQRQGDLDGEYIDSSEGDVTDELDFHRDHFAAAETPLVLASDPRPAIFRGLIAFEYIRPIAATSTEWAS